MIFNVMFLASSERCEKKQTRAATDMKLKLVEQASSYFPTEQTNLQSFTNTEVILLGAS